MLRVLELFKFSLLMSLVLLLAVLKLLSPSLLSVAEVWTVLSEETVWFKEVDSLSEVESFKVVSNVSSSVFELLFKASSFSVSFVKTLFSTAAVVVTEVVFWTVSSTFVVFAVIVESLVVVLVS